MRIIYFASLVLIAAIYFFFNTYRQSPPIYVIDLYSFSYEQESLKLPNNNDQEKMYDIAKERGISVRNHSARGKLLDSIKESRLPDSIRFLAALPIKEYVEKTKGDSLLILKPDDEIQSVLMVKNIKYYNNLPDNFKKFAFESRYNNGPLFFPEENFPLKQYLDKFKNKNKLYCIFDNQFETGLKIEKWNEFFSRNEEFYQRKLTQTSRAVPDFILHPFSIYKNYVIGLFFIILLSPVFLSAKKKLFPNEKRNFRNTQRIPALIFIILTCLSIFSIFSVFIFEINIARGGGAMIFLGAFFALIFLYLSFYYLGRTSVFDRIQSNDNNLTLWNYSDSFWKDFVEHDLKERIQTNTKMLVLVSFLTISIFSVIIILNDTDNALIIYFAIGLIIILAFFAIIVPRIQANKLSNSKPACVISNDGVILGTQFHTWTSFGNRFEDAGIEYGEQSILFIIYTYQGRRGVRYDYKLNIPIPYGEMDKAKEVVEILKKDNKIKEMKS